MKCTVPLYPLRLRFPFHVGYYEVDPEHTTPSLLEPDLISAEPLLSMLRMQYLHHMARDVITSGQNHDGMDPKLHVPPGELTSLRCLNLKECLVSDFELLTSASSHRKVSETLEQVLLLLHTARCLWERGSGFAAFPENMGSLWVGVAERLVWSLG